MRADAYAPIVTPEQKQQRFADSLPLVRYVAGRLAIDLPPSVDREDLCSWGAIGLWRAIQTFDASRGVAFSTHAYIHIRGAILDELRRIDFLPRSRRDKLRAVAARRAELVQKLGRPATPEELSEATGLEEAELDEVLQSEHTAQVLSIEGTHDNVGIGALLRARDEDDPAQIAEENELRDRLAGAIGALPLVERRVVTMYYSRNLLLKEIGDLLGFSESRASQIHARALERLRAVLAPSDAKQAAEA